tara:strand:+ start:3189 stop:3527 length:339 start_codon:yes stop_codon:yes gene_type:complete
MTEEVKRGLVLKVSLFVICISIVVLVFKFSGSNNVYEDIQKQELDSIEAYMKHWYEKIDTNGNGVPDADENKDNVIFIPTSSTVETLKSKRIHRWPCVGPEDKEVILEETKE